MIADCICAGCASILGDLLVVEEELRFLTETKLKKKTAS